MPTWAIVCLFIISYLSIGLVSGAIAYHRADKYDKEPAAVVFSLLWPAAVPIWILAHIAIFLCEGALTIIVWLAEIPNRRRGRANSLQNNSRY